MKSFTKFVNITPLELYSMQVEGSFETIRSLREGVEYLPNQFGGLFGQEYVLRNKEVMQVTLLDTTPDSAADLE